MSPAGVDNDYELPLSVPDKTFAFSTRISLCIHAHLFTQLIFQVYNVYLAQAVLNITNVIHRLMYSSLKLHKFPSKSGL